jgi:hypothetical protein
MRVMVVLIALGLAGCNRDDADRRSASREAGRAAYRLSEDAKRAAEKARRELRDAGKEARRGWNEAKHQAKATSKASKRER